MTDVPPILAYDAGPRPDDAGGETIRLSAPSRWPPIVFACIGMTVTGMAIVGITIGLAMRPSDDIVALPADALCGVSSLLFLCPLFVYCLRVVLRRARFGRDAIWIQLTADTLTITSPATWGPQPMTVPFVEIEHIFVRPAGWSLIHPRIHTIFIDRFLLGSITVHYTGGATGTDAVQRRLQDALDRYWRSRT